MKVNKFFEIFPDTELQNVLWPNRIHEKEIEKDALISNLLRVPQEQRERFQQLFNDALISCQSKHIHKHDCDKLKNKFIAAVKSEASGSSTSASASKKIDFSTGGTLSTFRERSQLAQAQHDVIHKLTKNCRDQAQKDVKTFTPPEKGLDAHNVRLGARCNYLLAACPKNEEEAAKLYTVALNQGIRLFVSLLQSTEAPEVYNNFWTQTQLQKLILKDGWTIQNVEKQVLREGLPEKGDTEKSKIIASRLIACKPGQETRIMRHLHYEGWHDKKPAPDEDLVQFLLDEIESTQQATTAPIEINCKGGIGRTGTLAICHYIRQKIDSELAKGIALEDISIDVAHIIYQFNAQRNWIWPGFAQVHSITGKYYEALCSQKKVLMKCLAEQASIAHLVLAYGRGLSA